MTQQDGHDERTARQTELQRLRHGGEADGQRTHQHTQGDAKENRNQVRFLQGFGLIAHALRKMADALFRTHDLDAVAHLEDQVGIGLQLNTASQDTRNRHTVFLADVQMAQAMAGNGRFGNGEALRNQFGARFLPLFHVHGQFRTEDDARFILVLDIGNNQQFIPLLQRHIQIREENILAAFHSCNDQVIRVYLPHDIVDRLAEQGGILHPAGKTVGIGIRAVSLRSLLPLFVQVDPEQGLADDDDEKGTQHAQRIGDCISRGDGAGIDSPLFQNLLGGTQTGRIGNGTGHHTGHDCQVLSGYEMNHIGRPHGEGDHHNSHNIHREPILTEGTEEAGAHLQTDGENEQNQSEILYETQHRRVDAQAKMA